MTRAWTTHKRTSHTSFMTLRTTTGSYTACSAGCRPHDPVHCVHANGRSIDRPSELVVHMDDRAKLHAGSSDRPCRQLSSHLTPVDLLMTPRRDSAPYRALLKGGRYICATRYLDRGRPCDPSYVRARFGVRRLGLGAYLAYRNANAAGGHARTCSTAAYARSSMHVRRRVRARPRARVQVAAES